MCLRFRYSDSDCSSGLYSYAFFLYDYCWHNYYASTMNTFYSEYSFDDLLEYSKFDDLNEFLQSHCQKQNAGITMAKSKIPMHALIFRCGWETKSLHTTLVIFSLPYLITWDVERLLLTGSSSNQIRLLGASIQPLTI